MANRLVMQLRFLAFVVCALSVSVLITEADDFDDQLMTSSPVSAIANQSVRLSCPLPRSRTPRIAWFDYVYNQIVDPQMIFLASGNNRRNLQTDHPNAVNYEVDDNFTLTIRDLKLDDTGLYKCTSRINDTRALSKSYYLSVSGNPSCRGTSKLIVGQNTSLSCEARYTGNVHPQLEWRRGQDEVLESFDNDEVTLAKRVIDFEATAGDDGMTFTCQMTFGSVLKDCSVNVTVFYSVRDLVMDPLKGTYSVGEEIRCSANGNPTPDITILPDLLTPGQTGVGWRSVTIPKSLEGKTTTVECIASNIVNGVKESIGKTIDFNVVAATYVTTEEPDKPNPVRSESASSSGAIVGGIVVGIMILVIVVAAVFCLRLRKEKKPQKEENGGSKTTASNKDASQQTNQKEQQV